jgi:flagellar hook-associated protein 1 FlgK
MSLSQALSNAVAGLRVNSLGLGLVSSNVANAQTPGYVRKTLNQVESDSGTGASSVNTTGVNRELDTFLQQQIRTEQSGATYADLQASILQSLQSLYGAPGSDGTLESNFNNLTSAVQALSTTPDSSSSRQGVVSAAQSLAQQLNALSKGVQNLRSQAENGISNSVRAANQSLSQIYNLNQKLQSLSSTDPASAALQDQRDQAIDQLSQLIDIRVVPNGNQVQIFTNSGQQLVGSQLATLSFNAQPTVTPDAQWNADPSKRGVGTLTLNYPNGGSVDLLQNGSIRSGAIAAYVKLRDETLVQAQTQLDEFAANLSSLLSDKTTPGQTVAGPPSSSDLDISGLQNGNVIHLTYIDAAHVSHQVSIVRVDDPSALPLSNNATLDPNDQVVGVNFSGGIASVINQLNAQLGPNHLQFSGSSSQLTVQDDGTGAASVNAASVTTTATSLQGGGPEIPLFTDGTSAYTGAFSGKGSQSIGLAGRIRVNGAVAADPSTLVKQNATTPSGDATRANFLFQQLTTTKSSYSPDTGFGTAGAPQQSSLLDFSQQITAAQGANADNANQIADGQDVVLNTLQQKQNTTSGVNVDEEMAHLLVLQNAYGANARVLSTVKEMFDALLQIQ